MQENMVIQILKDCWRNMKKILRDLERNDVYINNKNYFHYARGDIIVTERKLQYTT